MAEKTLFKSTLVRKTVFDLSAFHFLLYELFKKNLGYSFSEDNYYQSRSEGYEEIEFLWTFTTNRDSYTGYRVWIECKVRGLKKASMKVGDLVKKGIDAEVELNMKANLITDVNGSWAKSSLKRFQPFYEKFIYKKQLDDYIARLWEHLFYVHGEMKAFFGLPNF